jgi:hypothetical protein
MAMESHSSEFPSEYSSTTDLQKALPEPVHFGKRKSIKSNYRNVAIALSGGLLLAICLDWRLVAATTTGMAVMVTVYSAQSWDWRRIAARTSRFWRNPNAKIVFAAGSGGSAVLIIYSALAIWQAQNDHWLGFASSLQFLATLGILALLLKQASQSYGQQQQVNLDRLVLSLASTNALDRLIATRQLGQAIRQNHLPLGQEAAIAEYCQVLLSRETVAPVREAALEILESLKYLPQAKPE